MRLQAHYPPPPRTLDSQPQGSRATPARAGALALQRSIDPVGMRGGQVAQMLEADRKLVHGSDPARV